MKSDLYVWLHPNYGSYFLAPRFPKAPPLWTSDINEATVSHLKPPSAQRYESITGCVLERRQVNVVVTRAVSLCK